MNRLIVLITLLSVISCKNSGEEAIFKSWKSYPVPGKEATQEYNHDVQDWIVYRRSDALEVTLDRKVSEKQLPFEIEAIKNTNSKFSGDKSSIATDDGYLVGFFRGEFGGNLWWFSKDGKERYEIGNYQLLGFAKRNNKIYAIEGLSHLTMSDGSILELIKVNERWVTRTYLALGEAPLGIDLDSKDNFIVMTSDKLLSIDSKKKIDTLVSQGFWNYYLYPTSLVVKNNKVYSGMRKGVYKYDLDSGKEEWLMK